MFENHKAFFDYLNFLQEHMRLNITIKDRRGWTDFLDREFSMSIIPYMLHTNSFCSQIKSRKPLLKKCINMGCLIEKKCVRTRSGFYGQCHAGVEEFIMPVFAADYEFIGFITAGSFQSTSSKGLSRVNTVIEKGGFERNSILECYHSLRINSSYSADMLQKALGIAAKYLADLYTEIPKKLSSHSKASLNEAGILGKVLETIASRFDQPLSVPEIAAHCNCSESYLNHIFKRCTGTNIRAYINWVRMEKARELLKNREYTISKVSSLVGFSNPDYFSKVFTVFTGQTPRLYRKAIL